MTDNIDNMPINKIISYEEGTLNDAETLKLFAELITRGFVWNLQGHYGRTASALIEDGLITKSGELTEKAKLYL